MAGSGPMESIMGQKAGYQPRRHEPELTSAESGMQAVLAKAFNTTTREVAMTVADYARTLSMHYTAQLTRRSMDGASEVTASEKQELGGNFRIRPRETDQRKPSVAQFQESLAVFLRGGDHSPGNPRMPDRDGRPRHADPLPFGNLTTRTKWTSSQTLAKGRELKALDAMRIDVVNTNPHNEVNSNAKRPTCADGVSVNQLPVGASVSERPNVLNAIGQRHLERHERNSDSSVTDLPMHVARIRNAARIESSRPISVDNSQSCERVPDKANENDRTAAGSRSHTELYSTRSLIGVNSTNDSLHHLRTRADHILTDYGRSNAARSAINIDHIPASNDVESYSGFMTSAFEESGDLRLGTPSSNDWLDSNEQVQPHHINAVLERILNISRELITVQDTRALTIRAPRPRMRMDGHEG